MTRRLGALHKGALDPTRRLDLWGLVRAIADGDGVESSRLLATSPRLAVDAMPTGASRDTPGFFVSLKATHHGVYAGDTALHIAAAAYQVDKSGVTPLHRAVRTRCAAAVRVLLAGGADARRRNGTGSTPLHLAVQNTGRGGSGTLVAVEQQRKIIQLLLDHGAQMSDRDGRGRTVAECSVGGAVD